MTAGDSGQGAASGGRAPLIQLTGAERTYMVGHSPVHALAGIDLAVEAGEYLSIMGPSGSGKSTLLHVIGLLDRPDRGAYLLEGRDTGNLSERERAAVRLARIGFVFQSFHLVPRLTAAENVALPLELAGVAPEVSRARALVALASLGMEQRADHRPDQLSGGQRQRTAIARATIMRPSLILADEPTGNLDRGSSLEVMELLEGLNRDGIAVLVVTHDPVIGERAHRLVRVEDGKIAADSTRTPP
ncbi:MAG: ABC transporter ATP-binding protein [Nitrospirota bacterium]|nr:ABC transporter ATP-binding protein [Nitrospirota bacterium]